MVFLRTLGEDGEVGALARCTTWTLPVRSPASTPNSCALLLLLGDELSCVGVGDLGCERRGGRRGRDIDELRFSLRAHAQGRVDLARREPVVEPARGLRRYITELDELEVGVLLNLLAFVAAGSFEPGELLTELFAVEKKRGRRGVLLGLLLGESVSRSCDQHQAQQDPRRAATEYAQRLLEAEVGLIGIHQLLLLGIRGHALRPSACSPLRRAS